MCDVSLKKKKSHCSHCHSFASILIHCLGFFFFFLSSVLLSSLQLYKPLEVQEEEKEDEARDEAEGAQNAAPAEWIRD